MLHGLLVIARFAEEEGKEFRSLSVKASQALMDFSWPGNVRQLENVLRNAVVLNDGSEITMNMLPPAIFQSDMAANAVSPRPVSSQ